MNKIVNIYPTKAITSLNPPIRSKVIGVTKSTAEIRKCIIERAIVDEVLKDGSTVRLDFSNYDKDNNPTTVQAAIAEAKANIKEEPVKATKEEPTPVVEPVKEKTVETVKEEKAQAVDYSDPSKAIDVETELDFDGLEVIEEDDAEENVETLDAESL